MRQTAWFLATIGGMAAQAQAPAALPLPDGGFSGEHVTVLQRPAAAGENGAVPIQSQPLAPAATAWASPATGGSCRMLDLEFLFWKATGPWNKFSLFRYDNIAAPNSLFNPERLDEYRAGTFGFRPSPGLRLRWGRCLNAETETEFGLLWLTDYHLQRDHEGVTIPASGFSGATTTRASFVPTDLTLDRWKVAYRLANFGLEGNLRRHAKPGLDWLFGWRYHNLHERFGYRYVLEDAPTVQRERFHTTNDFLGLQVGGERMWGIGEYGLVKAHLKGTLAGNLQGVRVGGPETPGLGLLTGATTVGYDDRLRLGTIIDFGTSIAVQLTPNIEASLGFGGMYFGGIVRGANFIDQARVAAGEAPTRRWSEDSLLLYGLNCGLKFNY